MLSVQSRSSIPQTRKGLPLTAPSHGPSRLPPHPSHPTLTLSCCLQAVSGPVSAMWRDLL